jgi:hypothetical protein
MCIQRADAVNVGGSGKYFGRIGGGVTQHGRGPLTLR